eukprot:Em1039g2a
MVLDPEGAMMIEKENASIPLTELLQSHTTRLLQHMMNNGYYGMGGMAPTSSGMPVAANQMQQAQQVYMPQAIPGLLTSDLDFDFDALDEFSAADTIHPFANQSQSQTPYQSHSHTPYHSQSHTPSYHTPQHSNPISGHSTPEYNGGLEKAILRDSELLSEVNDAFCKSHPLLAQKVVTRSARSSKCSAAPLPSADSSSSRAAPTTTSSRAAPPPPAELPPPPPAAELPPPPPAELPPPPAAAAAAAELPSPPAAAAELPPPPPAAAAALPPPPPAAAAAPLPAPAHHRHQYWHQCPHRHQQQLQHHYLHQPPPPATSIAPTTTSPAATLAAATTTRMAPMA